QDGVRAVVHGADVHHRVAQLRVLAHVEFCEGAQPENQDEQADDQRQYRLVDEDVGEFHRRSFAFSARGGAGFGAASSACGGGLGWGPGSGCSVSASRTTIPILAFPLKGKETGSPAARGCRPYRFCASGAASAVGCTLLLMVTSASLRSLSRPLVATCSP